MSFSIRLQNPNVNTFYVFRNAQNSNTYSCNVDYLLDATNESGSSVTLDLYIDEKYIKSETRRITSDAELTYGGIYLDDASDLSNISIGAHRFKISSSSFSSTISGKIIVIDANDFSLTRTFNAIEDKELTITGEPLTLTLKASASFLSQYASMRDTDRCEVKFSIIKSGKSLTLPELPTPSFSGTAITWSYTFPEDWVSKNFKVGNTFNLTDFQVKIYFKSTNTSESFYYFGGFGGTVISGVKIVPVNVAPNEPDSITIPDTIRGGEDASIIWSAATDPDGNLDGYIVERSYNGGSSWTQIYQGRSTSTTTTIPFGTETVMFRVCAYNTYGEKSGWRTSANKTVINNRAPAAPPSISVPLKPAGGESLSVTWTASTDADGNLEGYELERQWDGAGAFTQIYKGAALSFQDNIPKAEHTSVVYRVRAYDSFTAYSSYTTSPTRQIDNNTAPVIECSQSGDLGEKSEGFSIQYTIKDAEKHEVTVTETVGDLVKRTYKATLDEQVTFEITDEYFQRILNGAQTVQIVATDSAGKSSTLSLTFTKAVHKAVITLSEPLAVEEPITVAVLAITGKIPADATQLVELTNNGNDAEPVWEDATADVKAGRNHPFTNKTQTNGWAFNFRVTVERGESGEDGNIVSIQGGFQ